MFRAGLAIVLAAHGLVHLVGFVVPWRLAVIQGMPDPGSAFFGHVHLGEGGARAIGVGWLVVGLAFGVAAAALAAGAPWSLPLAMGAAIASTALCVFAAPSSIAGVVVDVALLLLLGYASLAGGFFRAIG